MTDEQQPDLRWAPTDPTPSNRWRIWLIVGLIVAGLVVAAVLVFLLLPRGGSPDPGASPSASPTASASPSVSPSSSPTAAPEPTMTPITTPPPPVDPTVEAFRGQVQVYLDDALVGLDIVSETSGDEALAVVATLEADAQRLAETAAPSTIAAEWGDALGTYAQRLTDLRDAVDAGRGVPAAVDAARDAAETLRDIVGL
ncbi:hypothetical protein [Microbacterium sp. 3J1]|uniref:hypothetical protein n=1 Tax=Microbacterium sp. 3J1 TaxID=861269 RepID=UPI000B02D15E|nr:hypothetical protein [Microbacterium sp. 3J1]